MSAFDFSQLNWNIHTRVVWVAKQELFIERFKKMNFIESISGGWTVPVQVGSEVQAFIDKMPDNPVILEIAYDLSKPKDILYALKVKYADCNVIQYLHSNGMKISVIAIFKIPSIKLIEKDIVPCETSIKKSAIK